MGNSNELYHYGVLGMKWGVRKAARKNILAARSRRDASISSSTSQADVRAAKKTYRQEKKNIKKEARKTMSIKEAEIRANEPGVQKAARKALKGIGVGVGMAAIAGTSAYLAGATICEGLLGVAQAGVDGFKQPLF